NVTNSTFYGNAGGIGGGAIDNRSTVNVTNSTFYGNTALNGGAIANGLQFESAATNVVNSTFSGNGTLFGGDAIASRTGTVTVANSILANSTSAFTCLPNPTEV